MKAGWEVKPLGEVCTLQRGFDLPKRLRTNGPFPLVTSNGPTDTHDTAKVTGPGVTTGRSGTIGAVHYIEADFWPLNTALYVKDFHGNDEKYIWYLLQAFDLSQFASGAGVPTLNRNHVHGELVATAGNLEVQKRIVAVLDAAFEGLTRAKENAETNLQNARELFVRLVEERFAELSSVGENKKIEEIAQVKGGKRLPKGSKFSEKKTDYPYISVKNFTDDGSIDYAKLGYIDLETHEAISRYIINKEDMYISIAGTIGKTGIVPLELDGAHLTENAARLIFVPEILNEYVYFFSKTANFQDQVGLNTRTAAQPKLALVRLKTVTLPIVGLDEQRNVISDFEGARSLCIDLERQYQAKVQDIADLRQSLLQKAFAGELT
ncbi:restriction endonuclease subunit S [Planktotalea arctica]|uniref:restriction endonuclease subunit S n=1 Tax=Planktotalea arctica TaxID=1481893 RepID=UPI000A16FC79|nr:restriction endonuclease subunit S [Planktotalea arctica]